MKKRIFLISGHSGIDRITLDSLNCSVTAIRLSTGEIKFEIKEEKVLSISFFIYTLIGYLIFYVPHYCKVKFILKGIENNTLPTHYYLALALWYLIIMLFPLICMQLFPNILKNHSAEHKIINAYHHLKRIPTIEEAKKFSRFSFFCGSNLAPAMILSQLLGYFVYKYMGLIIPEILLFIIPHIFPGIFLVGFIVQIFSTQKPSDENIELAIAAISKLEEISDLTTEKT